MAFKFHKVAPKIPVRPYFFGDKTKARTLAHVGGKRLNDLITGLSFRKLQTGSNSLVLSNGAVIKTSFNYGVSRIEIYFPETPIVPVVVEEQYDIYPVKYISRIVNPGTQTAVPAMDRIIVWGLDFSTVDPEQTDINRAKGFVPGAGTILLDVDVASNTVYDSAATGTDEEQILLANSYIELYEATNHNQDEFYIKGDLNDPVNAYEVCRQETYGSSYHDAIDMQIHEYIEESDCDANTYKFRHMISEVPGGDTDDQSYWRSIHCPCEGGDPEAEFVMTHWNNLDDNGPFYGDFTYRASVDPSGPDVTRVYNCDLIVTSVGQTPEVMGEEYKGLLLGDSYSSPDSENDFPCFFSLYKIRNKSSESAYSLPEPESYDNAIYYEFDLATTGLNLSSSTELVTPLEVLDISEFTETYAGSFPLCTDLDCFNLSDEVVIDAVYYSGPTDFNTLDGCFPCGLEVDPEEYGIPCDADCLEFIAEHGGWSIKSVRKFGSTLNNYESIFKMLDPETFNVEGEEEYDGATNFSTLVNFCENQDSKTAYFTVEDSTAPSRVFCNKVEYGVGDAIPKNYSTTTGIVIYVFVPEYFTTLADPEDPESKVYWDIHSARHTSDNINPYRMLDLEEYLLEVITDIQQDLRDSDVSKQDTSAESIYTLDTYGYTFDFGFIYV